MNILVTGGAGYIGSHAARLLVRERLNEGRPIVAAVWDFQRWHGHWPAKLEEVVPQFLAELPAIDRGWSYYPAENGRPWSCLSGHAGPGRQLIYGFPPFNSALLPPGTDHGWFLDDRDGGDSFLATD